MFNTLAYEDKEFIRKHRWLLRAATLILLPVTTVLGGLGSLLAILMLAKREAEVFNGCSFKEAFMWYLKEAGLITADVIIDIWN